MEPQRLPFAKAFDTPFISLDETSIEMGSILFLFLAVIIATTAKKSRRQLIRHLVQIVSFAVFFFVVYSCLGVFGMIRNGLYGMSLIGTVYSESFYWMALPVVVISVTLLMGPIFCGWICPTGTIQEVMTSLRRLPGGFRAASRRQAVGSGLVLGVCAVGIGVRMLGPDHIVGSLSMRLLFAVLLAVAAFVILRVANAAPRDAPTRRRMPIQLLALGIGLVGFLILTIWISLDQRMFIEDSSLHWAAVLILLCYLVVVGVIDDLPTRKLRFLSVVAIVITAVSHVAITSPVHFAFTSRNDPASALSTLIIALASLVVARSWCRYLCPWGYLMGFLNRFSRIRLQKNMNVCTQCDLCVSVCDVGAIDRSGVRVEHCQLCYACVDQCSKDAFEVRDLWRANRCAALGVARSVAPKERTVGIRSRSARLDAGH